jgi:hypothetical protein
MFIEFTTLEESFDSGSGGQSINVYNWSDDDFTVDQFSSRPRKMKMKSPEKKLKQRDTSSSTSNRGMHQRSK